jgi:hypothetical protein
MLSRMGPIKLEQRLLELENCAGLNVVGAALLGQPLFRLQGGGWTDC